MSGYYPADVTDAPDILLPQHGAGADQGVCTKRVRQRGNAVEWTRRVQRNFDDAEAGIDQPPTHGNGIVGRKAAQDSDQGQFPEGAAQIDRHRCAARGPEATRMRRIPTTAASSGPVRLSMPRIASASA